jgi:hypothetical protein
MMKPCVILRRAGQRCTEIPQPAFCQFFPQSAMSGQRIDVGKTRLRADSCGRTKNLARSAWVSGEGSRQSADGGGPGKASSKPGESALQARSLRDAFVFPSCSLRILFVFCWCSSLVHPERFPWPHNGPSEPVPGFDSTGLAVIQTKSHSPSNGSVTVGEDLGGVRPSPGAATTEYADAPDFITSSSLSNIAAPEDGRTPIPSPSPPLPR